MPQTLTAERVYVVSPVHELAQNISGWLRLWGARPQIGVPVGMESDAAGVLLELYPDPPDSRPRLPWQGQGSSPVATVPTSRNFAAMAGVSTSMT